MTRPVNWQRLAYKGERDRILWRGNAEVIHETNKTIEIQFLSEGDVFYDATSQWIHRHQAPSEKKAACVTELERLQWKFARPKKVIVIGAETDE